MKNLFIIDIAGTMPTQEDIALLSHPLVAGVILFRRNFESVEQLQRLTATLRTQVAKPLLITVDQEGGRVQRFRQGLTTLPAMQAFSLIENEEEKYHWVKEAGWQMAGEVLAMGVDLSFAPVLDLGFQCKAIGDRSFSPDANEMIYLARAFIQGMHEAGMVATGKHFPGHGQVLADSHLETPIDYRTQAEIFSQDLTPFAELIQENVLQAIMPAHVIYPHCDDKPASGSVYWLQQILRQDLQFNGVIFSDDLAMKGADFLGDYISRCQSAFYAGCDLLLLCNQRQVVKEVLAHFDVNETQEQAIHRQARLQTLFKGKHLTFAQLCESERYQKNKQVLSALQQSWVSHCEIQIDPTEYKV